MSCVEYLRWQLRHGNGNGKKPENSPKPYTPTLGTREEVSLFFCPFLLTICKVTHQQSNQKKRTKVKYFFELAYKKHGGSFPTLLHSIFWIFHHLLLFIICWKKICFSKIRHFAIHRYSLKITAEQASVSQTFLRGHFIHSALHIWSFKWRKPLVPPWYQWLALKLTEACMLTVILITGHYTWGGEMDKALRF